MLDDEEPETLTIVETAPRPMVTMRVSRSSGAAEKPAANEDAELVADPDADLEKVRRVGNE